MTVVSGRQARRRDRWAQAVVVLLAVVAGLFAAWAGEPRDPESDAPARTGNVAGIEETITGGVDEAPSGEE